MAGAGEYGQGEGSLSRAASMVAEAKQDFDGYSRALDGKIESARAQWGGAGATAFFNLHRAWTEKQDQIVRALNEFEASLLSTEKDNVNTDETQSANYLRTAGRLG